MSEREVDSKAFNTCKGEVIIIGVSLRGWGVRGPLVYRACMLAIFLAYEPIIYTEIYTHACFLACAPSFCTHKTTLLDKPTMLVQ